MTAAPPRRVTHDVGDDLLVGLDVTQRAAVTSDAAPLAILAGAGSGKTRVLTRRIAWLAVNRRIDPQHVLAVTFTRKAAGELVARLARLGVRRQVTAGTFHAIALAQLRRRQTDRDHAMPAILERKARVIVPMLRVKGAEAALRAGELAGEIEWAKARLVDAEGYEAAAARAHRETPRPAAEVATIYARYEREKRSRGLVDFDDLIWWCADALENDEEFQATQRWRFRHLFVDEFQDVSPAQLRLVRAWLGDRADLCVVGDGDQAIYGFSGADAGYLTRFDRHFPGAGIVRLGANYRSSPQVVAAATAVLRASGADVPAMHAPGADGPLPTVTAYPSDDDEARGVATRIRAGHGPDRPWSSFAVLVRTNAQSAAFEESLRREKVPFRVRGGGRFLERPEVRAALDALGASARSAPARPFADHLTDLVSDAAEAPEERREHVEALARLGREYLAADGGRGSLDGFRAYLDTALRGDGEGDVRADAVELLTFHRAKGLEFPVVFVTGVERGLVPISHADTPAEVAEERRLLYVAVSRAERELHVSWSEQRTIGLRTYRRTPSPWLGAIEATLPDFVPEPVPARDGGRAARDRLDAARDRTARAARPGTADLPPPDAELLAALVEWRRSLARASSVPAFVIFHDSTLAAIAGVQPRTREALLALPGIGPVKAERHGDTLLELISRHAASPEGGATPFLTD